MYNDNDDDGPMSDSADEDGESDTDDLQCEHLGSDEDNDNESRN